MSDAQPDDPQFIEDDELEEDYLDDDYIDEDDEIDEFMDDEDDENDVAFGMKGDDPLDEGKPGTGGFYRI